MNKYELGKLLGKGNFAKVYHARNIQTGQNVAIKVIDKSKIPAGMTSDQIKREISVMRLVRHPNVVHLFEVMASRSKIYFIMELARGGELFNKVVAKGRLREETARKYFQQLIAAVEFCHSRGVYHRDLKPENLLLDEQGNLKVSDFGLSAIRDSTTRTDGLLHTTCGTPAYVAPEVVMRKGYDGAKTDIWSCGVVLFVLLAGYLPFHDPNLMELYRKIARGKFKCPDWFNPEAKKLVVKILDPSPARRITIASIMSNSWFRKGFRTIVTPRSQAAFDGGGVDGGGGGADDCNSLRPAFYNAFDIISLSRGFDLSGLFESDRRRERESRFTTQRTAAEIVTKFEEIAAENGGFEARREGGGGGTTVKLEGREEGRKGQLVIDAEIFEVTPAFHVVEMKKVAGDTLEYVEFCDGGLRPSLKDIVWAWQGNAVEQAV
ncbi:CBL-interacting serine/threonine-protein kinase 20 [Linum perenne]